MQGAEQEASNKQIMVIGAHRIINSRGAEFLYTALAVTVYKAGDGTEVGISVRLTTVTLLRVN